MNPSIPVPGIPYVSSGCSASMAHHQGKYRISKEGGQVICRIKHPAKTAFLCRGDAPATTPQCRERRRDNGRPSQRGEPWY
jgi:hypothetical protein